MNRIRHIVAFMVLLWIAIMGCDTVLPSDEGTFVVQAYFDAGRPLPPIRVGRTQPLSSRLSEASFGIGDATVELTMAGVIIPYVADESKPGVYRPEAAHTERIVEPGSEFILRVSRGEESTAASGTIPPAIRLRDIRLQIPDRAIEAVFLDSLDIGLDSLNLGLDARTGYIYPIQVSIDWNRESDDLTNPEERWIETRLDPVTPFSSTIVDFFLLPAQIFKETSASTLPGNRRSWSGVYAVPVPNADDPLPEHDLKVTLLRSGEAFARFTTSKNDPQRREPVSNVVQALGFVGGVSIDSLRVPVGH